MLLARRFFVRRAQARYTLEQLGEIILARAARQNSTRPRGSPMREARWRWWIKMEVTSPQNLISIEIVPRLFGDLLAEAAPAHARRWREGVMWLSERKLKVKSFMRCVFGSLNHFLLVLRIPLFFSTEAHFLFFFLLHPHSSTIIYEKFLYAVDFASKKAKALVLKPS